MHNPSHPPRGYCLRRLPRKLEWTEAFQRMPTQCPRRVTHRRMASRIRGPGNEKTAGSRHSFGSTHREEGRSEGKHSRERDDYAVGVTAASWSLATCAGPSEARLSYRGDRGVAVCWKTGAGARPTPTPTPPHPPGAKIQTIEYRSQRSDISQSTVNSL